MSAIIAFKNSDEANLISQMINSEIEKLKIHIINDNLPIEEFIFSCEKNTVINGYPLNVDDYVSYTILGTPSQRLKNIKSFW